MAPSVSDLVVDSKLDVKCFKDYSIQTRLVSNLGQRRTREQERWEVTKELGRGSYGVVWLEKCTAGPSSGEVRAVKELMKGTTSIKYGRELEAIAKFSQDKYQDCFVRSFGWYENNNTIFITMEYIQLGDLEGYLENCLTCTEARHITQQLLEGLGFMHENNFAHRDLKPANVLVLQQRPKWWVKIADFGIAKRIDGTELRTRIGTEAYLAPEVRGIYTTDSRDDDESTFSFAIDIWAVGAITFRMITSQLAFSSGRKLFDYVVHGHPFIVEQSMSPTCADFVAKTMAASPRRRPTSQQALSFPWILEQESISEYPDVHLEPIIKRIDSSLNMASTPVLASAPWSTLNSNQEHTVTHLQSAIQSKELTGILSSETATQKSSQSSIKIQELIPNDSDFRPTASTNLDETKTTPSLDSLQLATTQWSENFAVPNTPNSPFTRILANSSPSRAPIKKSQTFISLQSLQGHSGDIDSVSFSPDGLQLASGSRDNTTRIWADKQGRFELAQELTGHNNRVRSVAFSPNGHWLASGSEDKTIRIWADKQGRLELAQVLTGRIIILSVAFSPNGLRLASGSSRGTIQIWAEKQGRFELAQELTGHNDWVYSVAFSPDGLQLASGSRDNTIRIWTDKQGRFELAQELTGHNDWVLSVAFSPNGQWLASSSKDKTIRIWADKQGRFKLAQELTGHSDWVSSVALSPDGLRLASCSDDKTIRIWADKQGRFELAQELTGHNNWVRSVTFSPNGQWLASCSYDKTIRIWAEEQEV